MSCTKSTYTKQTTDLQTLLSSLSDNNITELDKEYYFIIPLEGCSTCIKYSIEFAHKKIYNENILFIITHYDTKVIKNIFKIEAKNIIIDNKFEASSLGLVIGSPVLIKVKDKKILNITNLDTSNIKYALSNVGS